MTDEGTIMEEKLAAERRAKLCHRIKSAYDELAAIVQIIDGNFLFDDGFSQLDEHIQIAKMCTFLDSYYYAINQFSGEKYVG